MLVLAPSRSEVPSCIVQAAWQSNLVCDGRLVVDAAFRTTDPKIFAAGPIAKFSRRSGCRPCHEHKSMLLVCQLLLCRCCEMACCQRNGVKE